MTDPFTYIIGFLGLAVILYQLLYVPVRALYHADDGNARAKEP